MARLLVVDGPSKGATHGLSDEVTLGRTADCDVRLLDVTVSRRHARLERVGSGYVLIPLTNSNITALNDAPVSDRVWLKDGDMIRLGGSVLRFSAAIVPPPSGVTLADAKSYEEIVRSVPASDLPFDTAPRLRSLDEAERFVSALQAISGIARAVAAILDVDELLERIMEMSLDIYQSARRAMIMMLEPGTKEPGRIVFRRKKQGDKREIVISKRVLSEVVELQRAVLSRDASHDDRFKAGQSIALGSVRAMMCAPLVFRGEILGVLYVDSDSPGAFDEKDLEMLAGIAAQSATALGVAHLHQEVLRRERLERDLKLAVDIQKSFVPSEVPKVPGWDFAVEYRPARGVSGDYYDFLRLSSGAFAVVIADVMGKGLGAALHMARLTRDLRHAATYDEDPALILARLNEASKDLEQSNAFVTMTVIVVEPGSDQIRYSSAGHGPLLVRGRVEGKVHALDPEPASAIGMFGDSQFVTTHHTVSPGDTLVLFTDGVVEATSPSGEMLGLEGLGASITKGESSAKSVLASVISSTQSYVGRGAQGDDITVVTLHFQG